MKVLIFKDENEDVQLKENLTNLGFYEVAECDTMTKEDILLMYQAFGDKLKFVVTDFIKTKLTLEINQLLNALNIKITEYEFYSQFKARDFGNLTITECLRIEQLFKSRFEYKECSIGESADFSAFEDLLKIGGEC